MKIYDWLSYYYLKVMLCIISYNKLIIPSEKNIYFVTGQMTGKWVHVQVGKNRYM